MSLPLASERYAASMTSRTARPVVGSLHRNRLGKPPRQILVLVRDDRDGNGVRTGKVGDMAPNVVMDEAKHADTQSVSHYSIPRHGNSTGVRGVTPCSGCANRTVP